MQPGDLSQTTQPGACCCYRNAGVHCVNVFTEQTCLLPPTTYYTIPSTSRRGLVCVAYKLMSSITAASCTATASGLAYTRHCSSNFIRPNLHARHLDLYSRAMYIPLYVVAARGLPSSCVYPRPPLQAILYIGGLVIPRASIRTLYMFGQRGFTSINNQYGVGIFRNRQNDHTDLHYVKLILTCMVTACFLTRLRRRCLITRLVRPQIYTVKRSVSCRSILCI